MVRLESLTYGTTKFGSVEWELLWRNNAGRRGAEIAWSGAILRSVRFAGDGRLVFASGGDTISDVYLGTLAPHPRPLSPSGGEGRFWWNTSWNLATRNR